MHFEESKHPRDKKGRFSDKGESDYPSEINKRIRWAKDNGIELPLNSDGSVDDLRLQKLYAEEKQHAKALSDFISRVKRGEAKAGEVFELGNVSSRTKADIEYLTGQKLNATRHVIGVDEIRHIEKGHGEQGKSDRSMSTIQDYRQISDVLSNYNRLEWARNKKGEIDTTNAYLDKSGRPARLIKFTKEYANNEQYVIEAVSDTKGRLHIISSYKKGRI